MRNRVILLGILAAALFGSRTSAFCDTAGIDPRDVALDKSLGGMKEGSRILSPHGNVPAGSQRMSGISERRAGPSPAAREIRPSPGVPEANQGVFVHGSSGNTGGTLETSPGGGTETGGSSGGVQEPAGGGTSESSIIEVEADANLETDNPTAGGDVTINPDAGGGLVDANTETTTGTGGQETPSDTNTQPESGGEQSIIEADVEADLSGGSPTVEAEATIDPNADDGLVDAEATTSSDIVEQELTSSTGLEVDNGANTTAAETTVSSETGGTTAPATNEVTGGVEADVEGAGAGDDVECNPADGLLCPPKL